MNVPDAREPSQPRGTRRRHLDEDRVDNGIGALDYPAARLVEAAAERGVLIYPLDRYYAGKPTMNGLILGYGTATLPQIRRAAAELARLLTRLPLAPHWRRAVAAIRL